VALAVGLYVWLLVPRTTHLTSDELLAKATKQA
jgi:hypothetical protein